MWIQGTGDEGKAAADFISKSNPLSNAPKPGEGPSRESRENGNYDLLFCGDIDDKSIHVSVTGDMDPGYGSTSKMLAECAICLALDNTLNENYGVITPSVAFEKNILERLQNNAGLKFSMKKI